MKGLNKRTGDKKWFVEMFVYIEKNILTGRVTPEFVKKQFGYNWL